jgi:hypothetical protein
MVQYPNLPSAIKHVLYSTDMKVPRPPENAVQMINNFCSKKGTITSSAPKNGQ